MDSVLFVNALEGVFALVTLGIIGYVIAALKWAGSESRILLPRIITNISLPPYLMYTIMKHFQRDRIIELLQGILPPLIAVSLAFILAACIAKFFRVQRMHFGLFCACIANSNTIFIGIPVNIAIFGESAMPYVLLYYMASTIFFWTIGQYSILTDSKNKNIVSYKNVRFSKIISPPLMGFIIGVFFTIIGVELPGFIENVTKNLGSMTTPLAMIFIGISIHDIGFKNISINKDIILVIIGRMLLAPMIMFFISKLFNLQNSVAHVFIVQSSLPVMMQAAILSAYYNADSNFGSQAVAYTTILSIVFIPILIAILTQAF